jgi:uncharacterized protein (TIGR03085 family)
VPRGSSEALDARERRELCDLFEELGPEAPTLCEGWTTTDLAAHLVVRERRPTGGPGILLGGPFARHTEQLMAKEAARGYRTLVDRVRNGPPIGPFAVPGLRTLLNLQEYVVHHEDVRRANGMGPRLDRPDLQDAVWRALRRGARLFLRRVPARVQLARRDGEGAMAVGGGEVVTITGDPVDLLLYLFGRKAAASVEVSGSDAAKQALADARLGL